MWLSQSSLMRPEMPEWLEELFQRLSDNDPKLTSLELTHQRIDDRQARMLAKALKDNTSIQVVILSCFHLVDDGAYALASVLGQNANIQKIQLRDLRISREALTFFRHLTHMRQLTEFSLRHCQVCPTSAHLLKVLLQNKYLQEVRLVDTQFLNASLADVCQGLQASTSIRRLYIVNANIGSTVDEVKYLAKLLASNDTLKEMYLSENNMGDQGVIQLAEGLLGNQTLQVLDLRSNGIGAEGAVAISAVLSQTRSLKRLSIAMNDIRDVGASALAEGLNHNGSVLEELDLSENDIGEVGACSLANMLLTNTRLCDLNLAFNRVGSTGVAYFANALEHNDTLLRLSLRRNNIDNLGASMFASKLPTMRGLKELVMVNNPIDQEGSTDLLNGLRRNMEIVYLQVGDSKSHHCVLKEIFHWIRLNQAGRRIFRQSNLPVSVWPQMLGRLASDTDVLYHFLSQKPEILEMC
ncbi:leucine rich repeat LRR-containing protein [Nitzschia inconspicua]|uniref:Leucine rich repeat LRR-containing protein n=1 Tax=Nitzschia inconspicua TaxID=303405 RepID=A0A9K3LD63_9STRA|nr:leucine rich repeat LRR-containing protein [Nitzschia inconspicua]